MILNNKVFLTQTDTTIGFVSQNAKKLTQIKQRPPHKYYIRAVHSLEILGTFTRVPSVHKNRVRRSQKTTFIMPDGDSYRVVPPGHHHLLLERLKWVYTTSANLSNHGYDAKFVQDVSDVTIEPLQNIQQASSIYKLNSKTLKRIR